MAMNNSDKYQLEYASKVPEMYNQVSREQKARRMVKILESYYGKEKLAELTLLDLGSSTGFIDNILSPHFKEVIGIDIDRGAVKFAQEHFERDNLSFSEGNAMQLKFKANSVDIIICSHIYEHVPDSEKLFSEIYRVLKPGGVCFLAAVNKWWPLEPHYKLPFLSWVPKSIANFYMQMTGKGKHYYESLRSYWGLKQLTKQFKIVEYTDKIIRYPNLYGYDDVLKTGSLQAKTAFLLTLLSKFLSPTFFWLLVKNDEKADQQQLEWLPTPSFLYRNYLYAKIAEKLPKNSRFLDVGEGNGRFLKTLINMGFKGESIDPSKDAVELMKKQLNVQKDIEIKLGDIRNYQPGQKYDVVFCFEVLEHIKDDLPAMKKIFDLLNPGGVLVFSVPAHMSMWSKIDEVKGHYRRYEKDELKHKIPEAGFIVEKILTYGFPVLNFFRLFSGQGKYVKSKTQHLGKEAKGQESGIQQEYNPKLRHIVGNRFLLFPVFRFMDLFTGTNLGLGYVAVCRKPKNI